MPQLDKYIFFDQISVLIFFFFLIYFYVRGTVVPKLNTILKYRTKKHAELLRYDIGHKKLLKITRARFIKLGLLYIQNISTMPGGLLGILTDFNDHVQKQITVFFENYFSLLLTNVVTWWFMSFCQFNIMEELRLFFWYQKKLI